MSSNIQLPVGIRLRRARLQAGLSQKEVAVRAGVSQPLVSYFERSAGEHSGDGLSRIAAVLGVEIGRPLEASSEGAPGPADSTMWIGEHRTKLLESLQASRLQIEVLDESEHRPSGDIAFALDLKSHELLVLLDGVGSGPRASLSSLLQASAMIGSVDMEQRGLPWPDGLLRSGRRLSRSLSASPLAAGFVALLDHRHQVLMWASEGFPSPWLRTGARTMKLGIGGQKQILSGKVQLSEGWLLLAATDGIANLPGLRPGRSRRSFWESRDVRELVSHCEKPAGLIDRLRERVQSRSPTEYADDRLALAVSR